MTANLWGHNNEVKKSGKKKFPILILAVCLAAFGIYAGIDQIIFQSHKVEYVSAVKQYVNELAEANSITHEERKNGTASVVAGQKEKMNRLYQKYPSADSSDFTKIYLHNLETKLNSGWKWYGVKIGDVKEISAWKSPFQRKAHVILFYSETVSCDSGGTVLNNGDVAEEELEKGQHQVRNYYQNEFTVLDGPQKQINIISTNSSNQNSSSSRPTC